MWLLEEGRPLLALAVVLVVVSEAVCGADPDAWAAVDVLPAGCRVRELSLEVRMAAGRVTPACEWDVRLELNPEPGLEAFPPPPATMLSRPE